jgi:hypothetical protein
MADAENPSYSDTFMEIFELTVTRLRADFPDWREGQTYYNALHLNRPEWAQEIHGGTLDTFHRDDYLPEFRTWLRAKFDGEWEAMVA